MKQGLTTTDADTSEKGSQSQGQQSEKTEKVSTTINGYEIYEVLGKGSFGQVFKAKKNGIIYALKLLDLHMIRIKKIEKFVSNEINLMRRLKHPNVVKIYEVFQTTSVIFLVLEFCNQGTLLSYVAKKKPDPNECVDLFIQILAGVKHIHQHKILHRDLKPENIFLHDGVLKIADFGLAQFENDEFVYCGTSFYMAPEILQRRQVTYKSDLWSLGIIMYYMLFRRLPFYSKSNLLATLEKWTSPFFDVLKFLDQSKIVIVTEDICEFFSSVLVFDPIHRASFKDLYDLPLIQKKINDIDYRESYLFYSSIDNTPDFAALPAPEKPALDQIEEHEKSAYEATSKIENARSLGIPSQQMLGPTTLQGSMQQLTSSLQYETDSVSMVEHPKKLEYDNTRQQKYHTEDDDILKKENSTFPSGQIQPPYSLSASFSTNIQRPIIQITSSSFLEDIPEDDSPNIIDIYPQQNITYFDKRREEGGIKFFQPQSSAVIIPHQSIPSNNIIPPQNPPSNNINPMISIQTTTTTIAVLPSNTVTLIPSNIVVQQPANPSSILNVSNPVFGRNQALSIDFTMLDFLTPKRFSTLEILNPRVLSEFEPLPQHRGNKDHSLSNQDIVNLSSHLKSSLFISDQECQENSQEIEIVRQYVFKYQLLEEIISIMEDFRMGYSTQCLFFFIVSKMIVHLANQTVLILTNGLDNNSLTHGMNKFKQTRKSQSILSFIRTDLQNWENKLITYRNGIDIQNDIQEQSLRRLIGENTEQNFDPSMTLTEIISQFSVILELIFGVSFNLSKQSSEPLRFKQYCMMIILIIHIQSLFNKSRLEQQLFHEYYVDHQSVDPRKLLNFIQEIKKPELIDALIVRFIGQSDFPLYTIKAIDFFANRKSY